MALSGTTNKQSFSPAAGTTSLTSSLPFFDTVLAGDSGTTKKFGDIKVARETSAGVITQLTPTSGVVGADNFKIAATNGDPAQGCTVTIASSTAGDKYTVERDVAYTQEYDLQEGATIDPTALNKAFDRVVAQNQQQNDEFSRSITFPVTDADTITYNVDTSATDRAGKIIGFDSNGSITELAQIQGSASVDTSRGLQLVNNQVGVKDDGITNSLIADDAVDTAQIANDAVEQAQIADNAVGTAQVNNSAITLAKMQNIDNLRVLGNTSGSTTAPQQVSVLDEDDLGGATSSATAIATQQSIKAYVDSTQQYFHLQETATDDGITITANTYTTRQIASVYNNITGASVDGSYVITLPAGTYKISGYATVRGDGTGTTPHQTSFRNTSDNTTAVIGASVCSLGESGVDNQSPVPSAIQGVFTIASSKTFIFRTFKDGTNNTSAGFDTTATDEDSVYADLLIQKIG